MRRQILALLSLAAIASPAAAQQVPTRVAGAEGRFETQLDPKRSVPGFSAASVTSFRASVDQLTGLLAAMPQVAAPPSPVCHRLKSWIELNPFHGVLAAEVGVMSPIAFENGKCHAMTGTGVIARTNALSLLVDPQDAFLRVDGRPSDWFVLPLVSLSNDRIELSGNRVALLHGRAPLFRPVSTERYLSELLSRQPADPDGGAAGELTRWLSNGRLQMIAENEANLREMGKFMKPADLARIAEAQRVVVESTEEQLREAAAADRGPSQRQTLQARLAALSPRERSAPACIAPDAGELEKTAECPASRTVVELNPAYFDRSRPAAAQLLVFHTPDGRTHGESDARLAARMAVWRALDWQALARLVE